MRRDRGFSLIELVISLALLAVLAFIIGTKLLPVLLRQIEYADTDACAVARARIERDYKAIFALYTNTDEDVTMRKVLDGYYSDFAEDISKCKCPRGGSYTVSADGASVLCSVEGHVSHAEVNYIYSFTDFDPVESYSYGDMVSRGGNVIYMCFGAVRADGETPEKSPLWRVAGSSDGEAVPFNADSFYLPGITVSVAGTAGETLYMFTPPGNDSSVTGYPGDEYWSRLDGSHTYRKPDKLSLGGGVLSYMGSSQSLETGALYYDSKGRLFRYSGTSPSCTITAESIRQGLWTQADDLYYPIGVYYGTGDEVWYRGRHYSAAGRRFIGQIPTLDKTGFWELLP